MYEYKFDVKIGSKVVNCKAFTLEQYRDLVTAKLNGNIESQVKALIAECSNAKGLNRQETELLLVQLWAHSLGEVNHQNSWKCSCDNEIPVHINLLHTQIDDPEDLWYNLGNLRIKLRYPDIFEDKNVAQMIATSIESVFVNGENIAIEDLTEQEINDLYSIISEDDIIAIKELILKPTVYLAVPIKCDKCGASHVHVLRGLKDFFKLM